MSNFANDVLEFHRRFGLPVPGAANPPNLPSREVIEFRLKFMREELEETERAVAAGDLVGVADGLVDLIYVAIGTAWFCGLPLCAVWDEVHAANLRKVRTPSADASKRGSAWDVVKPIGWRGPDVAGVLNRYSSRLAWAVTDEDERDAP